MIKRGWKYLWLLQFSVKGKAWKCKIAFQTSGAGCWAWVCALDRLHACKMGKVSPYPADTFWGVL